MAINISWKDKFTNIQLYKGMPKISEVIKQRRLRLAGHCIRHTDELAYNLIYGSKERHTKMRETTQKIHRHLKELLKL